MSKLTFLKCTVVLAVITLILTILSVKFRTELEALLEFKFVIGTLFCVNALNIMTLPIFTEFQLQEKHTGLLSVKSLCLVVTFFYHLTV